MKEKERKEEPKKGETKVSKCMWVCIRKVAQERRADTLTNSKISGMRNKLPLSLT